MSVVYGRLLIEVLKRALQSVATTFITIFYPNMSTRMSLTHVALGTSPGQRQGVLKRGGKVLTDMFIYFV